MKFCFVLSVSIGVWHITRYFENLKFYNSLRIIFYKIHSDYILKHNKNYPLPPKTSITVCVSQLASFPPSPGFWCTILDLWKLSLVTFCYLLVSFGKSFRRVSTPFVWPPGCFCTITCRCPMCWRVWLSWAAPRGCSQHSNTGRLVLARYRGSCT